MSKFPSKQKLDEVRAKLDSGLAARLLPKNASHVDKMKYKLCEKFVIYKNENAISQKELAKKIGIDEALMSKVLNYNIDEFTIDRLVKYLSELFPGANFKIDVA
jgi:predicted XRE-type DNA-binding protein